MTIFKGWRIFLLFSILSATLDRRQNLNSPLDVLVFHTTKKAAVLPLFSYYTFKSLMACALSSFPKTEEPATRI